MHTIMIVQMNTRPATSLRMLCDVAQARGIDVDTCLKGTGITADQLEDPSAQHTTSQEIKAIENTVSALGNPTGLGWAAGSNMHVNAFGIWGFAILTSPTLRAAIQTSVAYIKLSFVIAEMRLEEHGARARLIFDMQGLPEALHPFILERQVAIALNFVSELMQERLKVGAEIHLPTHDKAYCTTLSEISGLPVLGGQTSYALTFPATFLDRAQPKSDPVTLRFCLEQCQALSDKQSVTLPPWSQKVRDVILQDIEKEKKIDDISDQLSVTERTLRRRLTAEGTNFRELYTDVRMALAHELLEAAGLNVETVAWRVGYAETASFTRAFSRKYGLTPGEVRKASQAGSG